MPPLARLRQAQNRDHLQAFVELYGLHDLVGDGGLPRSLIWMPFERKSICEQGQFSVYGFSHSDKAWCRGDGPLARFSKPEQRSGARWEFIHAMANMGLVERVDYLAEGDSPDAELIHALSGDKFAEDASTEAAMMAEQMPGGFEYECREFDYVLPVLRHMASVAVIGVYRLTYRPHTSATSVWYAKHVAACQQAAQQYQRLAAGDFQGVKAA